MLVLEVDNFLFITVSSQDGRTAIAKKSTNKIVKTRLTLLSNGMYSVCHDRGRDRKTSESPA